MQRTRMKRPSGREGWFPPKKFVAGMVEEAGKPTLRRRKMKYRRAQSASCATYKVNGIGHLSHGTRGRHLQEEGSVIVHLTTLANEYGAGIGKCGEDEGGLEMDACEGGQGEGGAGSRVRQRRQEHSRQGSHRYMPSCTCSHLTCHGLLHARGICSRPVLVGVTRCTGPDVGTKGSQTEGPVLGACSSLVMDGAANSSACGQTEAEGEARAACLPAGCQRAHAAAAKDGDGRASRTKGSCTWHLSPKHQHARCDPLSPTTCRCNKGEIGLSRDGRFMTGAWMGQRGETGSAGRKSLLWESACRGRARERGSRTRRQHPRRRCPRSRRRRRVRRHPVGADRGVRPFPRVRARRRGPRECDRDVGHNGTARSGARVTWQARRVGAARRSWPTPRGTFRAMWLPPRVPMADPCIAGCCNPKGDILVSRADGQWVDTYLRVGEAENPGPCGDHAERAVWGAFGAQAPRTEGFHDVVAPGFESAGNSDADGEAGQEVFTLRIVTVNVTTWTSLERFLARTSADVVLVQEHKIVRARADDKVAWLRRRGWNALFAPAELGPNGGPSAGTAVLAKAHVGFMMPLVGSEEVVPARVAAARLEPPGCRPFTAISAYLIDGEGTGSRNLALLRQVGLFIAAQGEGEQYVLGADFQTTPAELAVTAFAQELKGVMMASGSPSGTCRTATSAREIDYFVTSPGLAAGVAAVDVVRRSGVRTHMPVELRFKPRLTTLRALVLRKPPPLAVERIVGPVRDVVDWDPIALEARRLAADASDPGNELDDLHVRLGKVYKRWADAAEEELVECVVGGKDMPKMGLRANPPVLVWRSILPERPRVRAGDDEVDLWRNAANAAMGLHRLVIDAGTDAADNADGADDDGQVEALDPDGRADDDETVVEEELADNMDRYHCDDEDRVAEMIKELAEDIGALLQTARGPAWDYAADETGRGALDALGSLADMINRIGMSRERRMPTLAQVSECRASIAAHLDHVAERVSARHAAAWTTWLRDGIDAGARNAHRYLRLPAQWRPQAVRAPDGILTADPAIVLQSYRDKYARRWNDGDLKAAEAATRARPPWADAPRCALPRTSAADIRLASRAFAADTGVAFDGMAMRHFSLLKEGGLEALADIILAMEWIGRLPPQLDALVMPLIGKERGGHRAITMATSLYRLWGRLRRDVTQRWEAAHDRAYFAAGKDRRVHDVVWRQLLRAEAGDGDGRVSAAVLWDMASFFDALNRVRLWSQVRRHDFPLVVARLAFSTYDAPRALTLDGRIACPAFARDGVPAGCPFAMALTRLYSLEPFDGLVAELGQSGGDEEKDFDAYVDDLVVTVTAEPGAIVGATVQAAEWLKDKVEGVMSCDIELGKAAVVASDSKVADRIARRLGVYAGEADQRASAVNLGCDFAPGRRRGAQRRSGRRRRRYAVLARRGRRLSGIRKAVGGSRRTKRLFATGLLPAAVPDAAVHGVSDREALTLRRTAALACSPRARGRSLALVSLLNDIPTWRAETEVVLQYARQVWAAANLGHRTSSRGVLGLTSLARLWRAVDKEALFIGTSSTTPSGATENPRQRARDRGRGGRATVGDARVGTVQRRAEAPWRSDGRRRNWAAVRGPLGAAILTLHRLGWRMDSPFVLTDDWGEELALTKITPAMLSDMLHAASRRALEHYVGGRFAVDDEEFVGRRICIDQVREQLRNDRKLTREGRAAAASVICNAVMTYSRAVGLGYLVIDRCPMCGCAGDTLRHRIWECQHPDVVEARRRAAPQWLQEEVARRPRSQMRWVNGIFPHPGDVWPRPATEASPTALFDGEGPRPLSDANVPILEGKVYVDGSCTSHVIPELKRAGTSVVTLGDGDETRWRIYMPVPAPMPQTSQSAEFVAVPMLHAYLGAACGRLDVASDCMNVVNACVGPAARAIDGKKRFGGLMKPVLADGKWGRGVTMRKVPAHVNFSALPPGDARTDAVGNDWADKTAKLAVEGHPRPSPALAQQLDADIKRARLTIRTVAAVMPLFPPMPAARMQRRPVARDGATLAGAGGHQWVFAAGYWRCRICWVLTVKRDLDAALAHRKCEGPKKSLEVDRIIGRGHVLGHASGQLGILFCTTCGAFSSRRAYGLGTQCRGRPTPAGAQALARIRRGQQPWQSRHEKDGRRPAIETCSAWDGSRRRFVDGAPTERITRRRTSAAENHDDVGVAPVAAGAHIGLGYGARGGISDDVGQGERDWHAIDGRSGHFDDEPQLLRDDWEPQEEADVFGHGGMLDQPCEDETVVEADSEVREAGRGVADGTGGDADVAMGHDNHAEARGTDSHQPRLVYNSAISARVGPGGPPAAASTAAELQPETGCAAAAVVAVGDRPAALQTDDYAPDADAEGGEAGRGPPVGCVAPTDGVEKSTVDKYRREIYPPQRTPHSLGVGPSRYGLGGKQQEGERPAAEKARRREGAEGPATPSTAACSDGTAAVRGGRDELETSSSHRAQGARQRECRDLRNIEGLEASGDADGVHDAPGRRPSDDETDAAGSESCRDAAAGLLAVDDRLRHARGSHGRGGNQADALRHGRDGGGLPLAAVHDGVQGSHRRGDQERVTAAERHRHQGPPHHPRRHRDRGAARPGPEAPGDAGADTGRHQAKRRRVHPVPPVPPVVWMQPPSWLYLPHVGVGTGEELRRADSLGQEEDVGGAPASSDSRYPQAAAAEAEGGERADLRHDQGTAQAAAGQRRGGHGAHGERGGEEGAIRGHASVPGAGAVNRGAAASGAPEAAAGGSQVAIRGRASTPGTAATGPREGAPALATRPMRSAADMRTENHRREAERRGLTRYFADIAEAAARRAAAGGALGDRSGQATASERLAALRRRIMDRRAAAEGAAAGVAVSRDASLSVPAAETIVPSGEAEALEDGGRAVAAPASNEDVKNALLARRLRNSVDHSIRRGSRRSATSGPTGDARGVGGGRNLCRGLCRSCRRAGISIVDAEGTSSRGGRQAGCLAHCCRGERGWLRRVVL